MESPLSLSTEHSVVSSKSPLIKHDFSNPGEHEIKSMEARQAEEDKVQLANVRAEWGKFYKERQGQDLEELPFDERYIVEMAIKRGLRPIAGSNDQRDKQEENGNPTILSPLEFTGSAIIPTTFDETMLAGNLHRLTGSGEKTDDGIRLIISSESLYRAGEHIPTKAITTPFNSSEPTREFLKYLGQESPEHAQTAFEENPAIKRIILDIVLGRMENTADLDLEKRETIRKARELLRLPDFSFLSQYYIGSSSAIMSGVEQSGGHLLSISELEEKGIARRTGEGMEGGASREGIESGISATTSWEVADRYAHLNETKFYKTPEKIQNELEKIDTIIKDFEKFLLQPEKIYGGHRSARINLAHWNNRKLTAEKQLQSLENEVETQKQETSHYPIIFGFDDLTKQRAESDNPDSFKTGHEVDLKQKLTRLYVPATQRDDAKQWLIKLGCSNSQIYPLEAVELIRDIDPTYERMRENLSIS